MVLTSLDCDEGNYTIQYYLHAYLHLYTILTLFRRYYKLYHRQNAKEKSPANPHEC